MKVGARRDMVRRTGDWPGLAKVLMDPLRLSQTLADFKFMIALIISFGQLNCRVGEFADPVSKQRNHCRNIKREQK